MVVPAAQVMLEVDAEDDEEVAASHLADAELRFAERTIAPRNRDHGVAVPADERLQGKLNRQVEVIRQERLQVVDHLAPVRLEGVCRVVVSMPEEKPDAPVGQTIERELELGVVVDPAVRQEP